MYIQKCNKQSTTISSEVYIYLCSRNHSNQPQPATTNNYIFQRLKTGITAATSSNQYAAQLVAQADSWTQFGEIRKHYAAQEAIR